MGNRQDKWEQEKGKLKEMTWLQKIEYIWMYYKIVFVAIIAVIVAIYLGITMYQGMHTTILANVVILGGDTQKAESLETEFDELLGASGKYERVRVKADVPADGEGTVSQTALTTLLGADAVDVLVMPKDVYEEYKAQDGFEDLEAFTGEGSELLNEDKDAYVLTADSAALDRLGVTYEEVYVVVPINVQNEANARTILGEIKTWK